MDVTENGNKCDDYKNTFSLVEKSNNLNAGKNGPVVQVGGSKNFNTISQDRKPYNVDTIKPKKEENNCILNKSEGNDNNEIKKSFANFGHLNLSHNPKPIFKYDTISNNECIIYTTKQNGRRTPAEEITFHNKLVSNETGHTFTRPLVQPSLVKDNNFEIGTIHTTPCLSNCFCEKEYNKIDELKSNQKYSKSANINQIIINKDTEIHSKSNNQILQHASCLLINEHFSRESLKDNLVEDVNKVMTESVNKPTKSYQCKNNMIDENIVSIYNNSTEILGKKNNFLQDQDANNTQILSTIKNYILENESHKLNSNIKVSTEEYCSSLIQQNVNHVNDCSVAPVIIYNTSFYINKSDDEVSSSHMEKKELTSIHSHFDSYEKKKNKLYKIELENMARNNMTLCEKNTPEALTSSININTSHLKTKKDTEVFPNISCAGNCYNTEFSQPCLNSENYKFQKQAEVQNVGQYQCNSSSTNNHCQKISYIDDKTICNNKYDSSLNSWNKDDSQRINIREYNKMSSKSIVMLDGNCPKFTNNIDANVELSKRKQFCSSGSAEEPLLTVDKLPCYVIANNHIKLCNKKSVPCKTKTLTKLQMNPPDFTKISLIGTTQQEKKNSRSINEHSASHKKNYTLPVTSQNFEEISKKFNYIKDLQLKNPTRTDPRYKESLRKDFEPQTHYSYTNLYIKTPDFSAACFSKTEKDKKQKIKNSDSIPYFNTGNVLTLPNDLPTTEQNNFYSRNYLELYNVNSAVPPDIKITGNLLNANTSNELYDSKNNATNPIQPKIKSDDKYFHKRRRISDNINQYYNSADLLRLEENLTAESFNPNINIGNLRNNSAYLQKERFSQNYFEEINNCTDLHGNTDYNVNRTNSVIQIENHSNLESTSNCNILDSNIAQESASKNNKQNVQSSQHFPDCTRNKSSLNSNNSFSNCSQSIPVATSPAHPQSINIKSGGQNKNEQTLQEVTHYHDMSFQTADKMSSFTKSKTEHSEKPFSLLPLNIPQNCKSNSYSQQNLQSYYNQTVENGQHQLPCIIVKNSSEFVTCKSSTNKVIEHNAIDLQKQKKKDVEETEYSNLLSHSDLNHCTSPPSKCSSDTSKILQRPNYREMINHVYAMRNSTTEDDLNLQIIKRTLNCDISLRKTENDLRQSIFDYPVQKKKNSTYLSENSFHYSHCNKKIANTRNKYNIDKKSNEYKDSQRKYQEQSYNMPIANNDISVTLSKITKLKKIKPFIVAMKNNINFNSEYPKAVITKVKKIDNSYSLDIDQIPSKSQTILNESTAKKKITAPLDLSVKTIKTIADSTGCYASNIHNHTTSTRSAPKFVFQPNFSNTGTNNNEKNLILHSITSSMKQNNNQLLKYPMVPPAENDTLSIQEQIKKELSYPHECECITPLCKKEHQIFNINKLDSNLLFPPSNTNLRIDGRTVHKFKKELLPWQQPEHSQHVNVIHQTNNLLPTSPKLKYNYQKLVKISNTNNDFLVNNGNVLSVQNLDIPENSEFSNIQKYNIFLQKDKINLMRMKKKDQLDNKTRNNIKKARDIKKRIGYSVSLPESVKIEPKIKVDYTIRKRHSDIKQTKAKKKRVDVIYSEYLEENSKERVYEVINNNFIVKDLHKISNTPDHEQKYGNNEQILLYSENQAEQSYNIRSQNLQQKILYPPIESDCGQEKFIFLPDPVCSPSITLPVTFTTERGIDQTAVSKLTDSIEKQKLAILPENNERKDESSKSDIASLLAARIRTKGELKGFNQPTIEEINNESKDYIDSDVINLNQLYVKIDDFSDAGKNSSLNLLDWKCACNDFVEQLKCGVNKKRKKKLHILQTCVGDKQLKTGRSHLDIYKIKKCEENEVKSQCTQYNKRNVELASDSSDEDKPLLLLRQQNNIQSINNFSKNIEDNLQLKTAVCEEPIPISNIFNENRVNKSSHSSIVEKLSEKVGRNIREKQRIEQEKRLVARLGKISSSESEDNKRNYRPKKITKMAKSKIASVSTWELSDADSSEAESSSMSNNLIRNQELSKKRKCRSLDNFKMNASKISTLQKEESNIDLNNLISEKQVMTKAEMKFMAPSKENNKKIFEQNKDSNFVLTNQEYEINIKKSNNCEINSTEEHNIEINKLKAKKMFSFYGQNNAIQLEETMTRSKRKKALENQIANSKILRNDKIINYTYVDKNEKKKNIKKEGIKTSLIKSDSEKKAISHKIDFSVYSSASSCELETGTVSNRLRPRQLSHENNINCKRNSKLLKKKAANKKILHSATRNKTSFFKKKKDILRKDKNNTSKFPPGWEDQLYEYKKSLKVPLRLITVKGSGKNRISTSLPDLDPDSSNDTIEKCSVGSKQKLVCYKKVTQIEEPLFINNGEGEHKMSQAFSDKNIGTKHIFQQQNPAPKSIIDVLHSRVFRYKKHPKRNFKTFNRLEPKVLPRSTKDLELLPTLLLNTNSETLNKHHNVFKTEVLKSRTRTETRNLKYQELIREVFGAEERSVSAPPEIRESTDKVGTISFEDKYEQYVQKLNVDFGEKFKENTKTVIMQSKKIENEYVSINETRNGDDGIFRSHEKKNIHDEYKKMCSDNFKDTTHKLIPNREGIVSNLFKLKKNNKYRTGRRKASSGFDYIRKKKKPSTITCLNNQAILKRKKASVEFHYNRDENDVSKEIQKWVLNKSVGQSALHKAARLGYLDVIMYCLERMGMNPDPKDNAGYTPLHEACSKGRIDIARVLLQYGANHSETAHSGIRPLHEASENGYIEIVRLLLSYGADPLLTTYSGQTPLMLSESNEMEQFIKNHLYDVQNTGPHKQPWKFQGPWKIFDRYKYGYDVLSGAPDNEENCDVIACNRIEKSFETENISLSFNIIEKEKVILNSSCNVDREDFNGSIRLDGGELLHLEEADIPLPPLYLLKDEGSAKWVLLNDLCTLLKVKSKDTLLKQICPTTPPSTINKELLRELKMSDFLEKATCLQLLCAGEKLNIRSSKVVLVKYNERVQTLLGVKTVVMKF